ncbi:MAG: APC family permease [Actinomycetota bacterium]|nr:APC family permease [Actinomycetota bacterium]
MLGAGVFSVFAPAAAAARSGAGLLVALALAAAIAYCNATSSARLAAVYPQSGGTYVYGRERLGPFWGYLAGWAFVVGKTASCAAMALTFGSYVWPAHPHVPAVVAVVVLTAVNYVGVQKSAGLTRLLVAVVLVVLALVVAAALAGGSARGANLGAASGTDVRGILGSAGLIFFAFAGYARIATLGAEVRDPGRTIPRAVALALAITVAVYAAVAVSLLVTLGPDRLAGSIAPLRAAVESGSWAGLGPVVVVGGAAGALGALLALVLGVSRTVFAMAVDGHLPAQLAVLHPRFGGPSRAEVALGATIVALVIVPDLRGAIGFSSFAVLGYYTIANVSAATLSAAEHRPPRWLPIAGAAGCLLVAFSLPVTAVLSGSAVLVVARPVGIRSRIRR